MPHTNNNYSGEWIEIYNEQNNEITLNNFKIGDLKRNDSINLTISAKGFGLIINKYNIKDGKSGCNAFNIENKSCFQLDTITSSGLSDSNESLFFYDNNSLLISNFSWTTDIKSSGKSWSFNNGWERCLPTPAQENNCTIVNLYNQTINQTNDTITKEDSKDEVKNTSLSIDDVEEIESYLFKIKVSAYNLESKNYDFKVYIEDKEKIISDIYDENLSKWVSGNYYLNDYYVNQNISKTFDIKLKESYKNINGNVLLLVKIRENGKTSIILSDNRTIKLNLKEITENKSEIQPVNNLSYTENENIIKLNSNEYPEEKTIYKSSNEKIKENLLIGFCIFLIIVIIVLLIR